MLKAKRAPYDMRKMLPALGFSLSSQPPLHSSYEVSLIIVKAPHTASEKLIKPCMVKMAQTLLGRKEAKRIDSVPLSDDTVYQQDCKYSKLHFKSAYCSNPR